MRAVFVNHCHPDTPHICGVRLREFADALARRGHQVVLFTAPLDSGGATVVPENLAADLARHDFSRPYHLAAAPVAVPALARLRDGRAGWLERQATILWHYGRHGGVFTDWRRGVAPYLSVLRDVFGPEVVWASFGNTDCWTVAQDLARACNCPWVGDVKDFWDSFIPVPLRRPVAGRFGDRAGLTALSDTHAAAVRPWLDGQTTTVYSGFPAAWLDEPPRAPDDGIQISLTGSFYDGAHLAALMAGLAGWLDSLEETARRGVRLIYAGGDRARFEAAAAALDGRCRVEARDFVPLEELAQIYRSSRVNAYVRSDRTFHHKVIELLAAGRPVLCYPREGEEAGRLADRVGGRLYGCGDAGEVSRALDEVMASGAAAPAPSRNALAALSWDGQAEILISALERVIGAPPNGRTRR